MGATHASPVRGLMAMVASPGTRAHGDGCVARYAGSWRWLRRATLPRRHYIIRQEVDESVEPLLIAISHASVRLRVQIRRAGSERAGPASLAIGIRAAGELTLLSLKIAARADAIGIRAASGGNRAWLRTPTRWCRRGLSGCGRIGAGLLLWIGRGLLLRIGTGLLLRIGAWLLLRVRAGLLLLIAALRLLIPTLLPVGLLLRVCSCVRRGLVVFLLAAGNQQ